MCGIAGYVSLSGRVPDNPRRALDVLSDLIAHRGPDGHGTWCHENQTIGFVHRRLSIIDLTEDAAQPMKSTDGNVITYNGETYNYRELRQEAVTFGYRFKSHSDTETILATYASSGNEVPNQLRGMFAFAIWDEQKQRTLIVRDRFGIKPLYYCIVDGILYFASEAKALLPFLPEIRTNPDALAEYLTFQYSLGSESLFQGIEQLMPGHRLVIAGGNVTIERYWDIRYDIDYSHHARYFQDRVHDLVNESASLHLRSDVEIGSYVSGGVDSTLIGVLASKENEGSLKAFHGRFLEYPGYDESFYAKDAVEAMGGELFISDITSKDFAENIRKVIYHLDFPVAGPGSFPQFMVSELASKHVKVVLGGQGGDEIFGGYARYLVAYFEQCIKAAINGTSKNGNFVVTIESIIPNLGLLREYTPLLQEFWKDGLFGPLDQRFLRLIDRSTDMKEEVKWDELNMTSVYEKFSGVFNNRNNVQKEAYFDSMTHFEFKTLLPALLQVEDRMSMAHGLESRVPLLDHPLIEFAATVPADVKFEGGQLKHLLKQAFRNEIPTPILERRDKMGFPVPLKEWFNAELSEFVRDVFSNMKSRDRAYINPDAVLANFADTGRFSRKTWALLSLELWQQEFHDKASEYRALLK
jgi:asparagine synthase (glutamine-hydrolysing)